MLTTYFEATYALRRFRKPTMARYIESFAQSLAEAGYARVTGRGYICAATQFATWADSIALRVTQLDEAAVARFAVTRRRRVGGSYRRPRKAELAYLPRFIEHLRVVGVVPAVDRKTESMPR